MAEEEAMAFDRAELSALFKAFKNMDEAAIDAAKQQSGALTEYLQKKIIGTRVMFQKITKQQDLLDLTKMDGLNILLPIPIQHKLLQ